MNEQMNRDLVRVATMYHKEDLKQSDIAKKMGISRSLVSKYLNDAKKEGIVDIYIKSESAYSVELELSLEKKFGLKRAVVLDTNNIRENEVEKILVQTAISSFKRDLDQASKIGISWGKMLRRFVDEFPYENSPETVIVPLIGGMGPDHVDVHSNQLAYDLARKIRGRSLYLYAPALVDNHEVKTSLIENSLIKEVLAEGCKVDLALVGIADPFSTKNTMTEIGYLNPAALADLKAVQTVGDINSRFFDRNGEEVDSQINENVIGVNLTELKKIDKIAAICHEESKKSALYVAIQHQLINMIAVTTEIAEFLLEKVDSSES